MDSPYCQRALGRKHIISRSQTYQSLLQPDAILACVHQPSFFSFLGPVITKDGVNITNEKLNEVSKLSQINSQLNKFKPDNPIIVLDSTYYKHTQSMHVKNNDIALREVNRTFLESSISIQNSIMKSLFLENCSKWEHIGYVPKCLHGTKEK